MKIYTTSISLAGIYSFYLQAKVKSNGGKNLLFSLKLINPCLTSVLSHIFDTLTFQQSVNQEKLEIFTNKFVQSTNQTICGPITLSYAKINSSGLNTLSFIAIDSDKNLISVFTNDKENAGVYIIQITAKLSNYTQMSVNITINLTLNCAYDVLSGPQNSSLSYLISEPEAQYVFQRAQSDIFQFDPIGNTLSIQTPETFSNQSIFISVIGNVYQVNVTQEFQLNITDDCKTAQFIKPQFKSQYLYELATSQIDIKFDHWDYGLGSYCKIPYYELKYSDIIPIDNDAIQFDPIQRKISIYTVNETQVGHYKLTLSVV
ncbi:UNKNOWN [Stylonychia lemnae]|uniref:Cadg domain containing protein n=1 Tax=Stylonychia lemnae TaxID=5949 RepID=A0A078AK99_STYLE|nr:UNKNOWN [Stylonychia lemnae]|eukprot:CDW82810.1 UNKNOWN [Stylonychia lemnae]